MLKDVSDSTAIAITILDNLLNYESMDAGTFAVQPEEVALSTTFTDHVNLQQLQLLAVAKSIDLKVINLLPKPKLEVEDEVSATSGVENEESTLIDASQPIPWNSVLHVDIPMFYQVIRNLVTNAIKFSPREQGSVVVTISASTSTRDVDVSDITIPTVLALVGSLRIDVKDNGAGISVENQRRVFGEFAQFDKNNLQGGGGSGLGLWISRRIMNLHGGLLSFTSEGVGKGSTFFICLPVFERKVVESQDVVSLAKFSSKVFPAFEENVSIVLDIESCIVPNERNSFRIEARRLKVLIVDDSAVNRKINKKLCAKQC